MPESCERFCQLVDEIKVPMIDHWHSRFCLRAQESSTTESSHPTQYDLIHLSRLDVQQQTTLQKLDLIDSTKGIVYLVNPEADRQRLSEYFARTFDGRYQKDGQPLSFDDILSALRLGGVDRDAADDQKDKLHLRGA